MGDTVANLQTSVSCRRIEKRKRSAAAVREYSYNNRNDPRVPTPFDTHTHTRARALTIVYDFSGLRVSTADAYRREHFRSVIDFDKRIADGGGNNENTRRIRRR